MTDAETILQWCEIIDQMPAGSTPVTEACRRLIAENEALKAGRPTSRTGEVVQRLMKEIALLKAALEGK
jgi:hypothetical protein